MKEALSHRGWVRLTPTEVQQLRALADAGCRDLSAEIRLAVRAHLAQASREASEKG